MAVVTRCACAAAEPRGNHLKGLQDFFLKGKARIWAWLSHMRRIRSTAALSHHPLSEWFQPVSEWLTTYWSESTLSS